MTFGKTHFERSRLGSSASNARSSSFKTAAERLRRPAGNTFWTKGKMMQVGVEFRLPARIRKRGKWYVSSCPSLDLHSQGHTKGEARQNLIDALVFFLESCVRRQTLGDVLSASGLRVVNAY